MAGLPAHCDQCGATFATSAFDIQNSKGITISNATVSCPNCGGRAKILDGTWDERGRGIELVDGPQKTRAIFIAFSQLVEQAKRGELTPKQVQKKAAELDEGIGRAVGMLIQRFPKSAFFAIALVAMLKYMHFETKLDVNQLVQQVIEYTEMHSAETATSGDSKDVKQEKSASDAGPAENRSTKKQDRVLHQKPHSVERRRKNRQRRQELLERRRAFNPGRK